MSWATVEAAINFSPNASWGPLIDSNGAFGPMDQGIILIYLNQQA